MIPKNKRRTITVNGEEFEYCVTGREPSIFIKNLKTKDEIHLNVNWEASVTPKDIHEIIETGAWGSVKARDKKWKKLSK